MRDMDFKQKIFTTAILIFTCYSWRGLNMSPAIRIRVNRKKGPDSGQLSDCCWVEISLRQMLYSVPLHWCLVFIGMVFALYWTPGNCGGDCNAIQPSPWWDKWVLKKVLFYLILFLNCHWACYWGPTPLVLSLVLLSMNHVKGTHK